MHNLQELIIWQKSMSIAKAVYEITVTLPTEERYGLTSQIRRSAISIPSNIAEGAGRNSNKEFAHFLSIANGSAYELETQLILARDLELIDENIISPILSTLTEIQKMNYTFQNKLKF